MVSLAQITELETLACRAWPAQDTQELGGWLLRATRGVTKRANSVLPLNQPADKNIEAALRIVEKFYSERKLPVRFQMTEASKPSDLDDTLDAMGFKIEMRVIVQTALLSDLLIEEPIVGVVVFGSALKEWFEGYRRFSGYEEVNINVRKEIIARIPSEKAYAAAIIDDKIVGIGLGVLDDSWLGLFSLVTDEKYRRQRVATSITQGLVGWAQGRGIKQAYLQVEEHNHAAKELYYRLGFQNAYLYWYRLAQK